MATSKPRITISLTPEQYAIVRRLSVLQEVPMSRIITDFFGEVAPILANVADTLEAAQRASSDARAKFVRTAEVANDELQPLAEFAKNQFDMFAGELERLNRSVSDPRPVITGVTEVNGESVKERRRADPAMRKPAPLKGFKHSNEAKVFADADNNGKNARVLRKTEKQGA